MPAVINPRNIIQNAGLLKWHMRLHKCALQGAARGIIFAFAFQYIADSLQGLYMEHKLIHSLYLSSHLPSAQNPVPLVD